jgi:hypothetical protein
MSRNIIFVLMYHHHKHLDHINGLGYHCHHCISPRPLQLRLCFRSSLTPYIRGVVTLMHCSLFKFTVALNSVLFQKLLVS